MRTAHKAITIVIALSVVGLTGCGSPSGPSGVRPTTASTPTKTATKAPTSTTTSAPTAGVAGYTPKETLAAYAMAQNFAIAAMAACGQRILPVLQSQMTAHMYAIALTKPGEVVLTFHPPTVVAPDCVPAGPTVSAFDGRSGGIVNGMPAIQVGLTITQTMRLATAATPTKTEPWTVSRRYTLIVIPSGTNWVANDYTTTDPITTAGK